LAQKSIKYFAAIDVGSNAVRLLVMSSFCNGKPENFKKTTLVRIPIRLGEDVFSDGKISPEKEALLINAFTGFSSLMKAYQVVSFRACATSAMREAENGGEIIDKIKSATNINLEIISGMEEAALIFYAGIDEFLDENKAYLYVDVGGGSTELTLFSNHQVIASESFQIGTVRTLQNKVEKSSWINMKKWIKTNVGNTKIECIIGSGGNINKLIKLVNAKKKAGNYIAKKELQTIFNQLKKLTYEERITKFDLNPDRADVIIPACQIFLNIMQQVKTNKIFVPKIGVADGLIRKSASLY
jgi:exopolyphosphatase / guanosine-5'-triphosphate,3'-diphosphate pyrophosphatase